MGTVLMAAEATPAQLPLVAARLLLAAFYFYFMLGLSFPAALLGAIATPVAIIRCSCHWEALVTG